jgi:hypothetical protein
VIKLFSQLLIFIFVSTIEIQLFAQESNVSTYTPAILFQKGQMEYNVFHSLYTQNKIRDRNGDKIDLGQRQSFLNGIYQFTYGISGRFNIGLDLNVNRAYYDDPSTSPLQLFSSGGDFNRTVITTIGTRIKLVPVSSLSNFSVQSTLLLPIGNNLETPQFVAHDRYTWFTQLFYDQRISRKWRAFFEVDFLYRIKRHDQQVNFFRLPISAFMSYFPGSRSTIFLFGQYAPRFQKVTNTIDEKFGLSSWYTQIGIGTKYQLTDKLAFELSYGNFIASREDGAGYTVNLGLRYIRK